jgi:hypothetical protein
MAVLIAVAFVTCLAVEPEPNGPHPEPPLWTLPIDLTLLAVIVAGCVALWRGSPRAHTWAIGAATALVFGTVLCPGLGHHVVGWYTWVQAGVSATALLASAVLPAVVRRRLRTGG